MRNWLAITAGAALLVSAAAILWPDTPSRSSVEAKAELSATKLPEFPTVAVSSTGQEGLSLTGTVLDPAGRPVPRAEVFLASSAQPTLATARCEQCGEPLLSCPSHETHLTVAELLEGQRGVLAPAAEVRADEQGRFKFGRLSGVSFTVWARARGLGEGLRERAAPGEPVELFLPPLRTIAGRLQDDRGQAVPWGKLRAISRRLPTAHEATSDGRGLFELRDLGEGPFYVLAQAEGFLPAVSPAVEAGPRPLHLTLQRPRRLEVSVRSGGAPAEALVRLSGDHLSREAVAQGGEARFERLFPDQIVLTASRKDKSSLPRTLALEEPVTQVTLELVSGGYLHVSVVEEGGQPVADPEVSVWTRQAELVMRAKGRTGELSSFGPLAEGSYLVRAQASGYEPAELPATVRSGAAPVELVLAKGTIISGRVLDEYGRPAPGISILIAPTGESVLADAEGRFSAPVPSPGFYQLHAHHSDWGGGSLKVSAPATGVELHLEPRAGAHVTVLAEGRRVEGADVVLFVEQEGSFRSDRPSGSDGVVLMRGMPPGTYWMLAHHPEYLPSERQKVTVSEGELVRVTAELKAGAGISGEVVDDHGAPVSGVALSVVPRGAEPAVSDGRGRFELRALRPGLSYRLDARHPRFEQREKAVATAGGPPARVVLRRRELFRGRVLGEEGAPIRRFRVDDHQVDSADGRFELPLSSTEDRVIFGLQAPGYEPLVVDRPATPDLGELYLRRASELSGFTRDSTGSPVAEAVVSCDVCEESVLSGPDGRFRLSRPPYVSTFTVIARKGRLSGSRQATPGGTPMEVRLLPAVRLAGLAYLPGGRPAAGVELEGLNQETAEPVRAVTSQDGSYALEVAPGHYRFGLGDETGMVRPFSQAGTAVIAEVLGSGPQSLHFGPVPGTSSLTVRVRPQPGFALWVVRGELAQVGNPPLELFRAGFALLRYQPGAETTFHGLAPGRYTVVWAAFHMETQGGPLLRMVDLPAAGPLLLGQ